MLCVFVCLHPACQINPPLSTATSLSPSLSLRISTSYPYDLLLSLFVFTSEIETPSLIMSVSPFLLSSCLFLSSSSLSLHPSFSPPSVSTEPEGVFPPEVVTLNSTAVRVLWAEPQVPNGAITQYGIYVDDQLRGTASSTTGSLELGDLLPFTVYDIQVWTSHLPPPHQKKKDLGLNPKKSLTLSVLPKDRCKFLHKIMPMM